MSIVLPLPGHTSLETAYTIADYPYGFRLRCQKKVWLERHPKKGYRLCSQTSNPKRPGTWNEPKKSTYTMLAVMGLDVENHVVWSGCSMYDFDKVEDFVAKYGHSFDADQLNDANGMLCAYRALASVRAKRAEPTFKMVDMTAEVMAVLADK